MQACLLEGLDQCTGIGAQRVGQDETGQQSVFIGQIDGQPLSGILFLRQFEPACTADAVMLALNYSLHAVADDGGDVAGGERHPVRQWFASKRTGDGVLGVGLQGMGECEAAGCVELAEGLGAHQADVARGQGSRLVHHDAVGPGQNVQHVAAAQQDAAAGQVGSGRGQCGRGGQREGAGTGRHQHRQGDPEGPLGLMKMPEGPDRGRNDQEHQDKVARQHVRQLGDGGLVVQSMILQAHDLGQTRLFNGMADPDLQGASVLMVPA